MKKRIAIGLVLLIVAISVFWYIITPKNFGEIYDKNDDLVTTFFLLYKTNNQEIKDIVNNNQEYDMKYKVDLVGGDLRQLSFKDENFLYAYSIYPKSKDIRLAIYSNKLEANSEVLSGKIEQKNKLTLERFNEGVSDSQTQEYFKEQSVRNLEKVFKVIYDGS